MKKNIIIGFVISLSVFGIFAYNNFTTLISEDIAPNDKINKEIFKDFIYEIGPRFTPIKKTDLQALKRFSDYIGDKHAKRIVSYKSMSVMLLIDNEPSDIRITGTNNEFTNDQLKFLYSLGYSTNLMIWADYEEINSETGKLKDAHWTPYLTIIPEKQAKFKQGKNSLMNFLEDRSVEVRNKAYVDPEKLQPAKLFFTVTKTGTIENVRLDRTSNYPLIDEKMIQLIKKTSGTWLPAENEKGEEVNQELVISFGLMGC